MSEKNEGVIVGLWAIAAIVGGLFIYGYVKGDCVLCKYVGHGIATPVSPPALGAGSQTSPVVLPPLPANATPTDVVNQAVNQTAVQNNVKLSQPAIQNITNAVTQAKTSGATVPQQQAIASGLASVSDVKPYQVSVTQSLFSSNGQPAGSETFQITIFAQSPSQAVSQAYSAYSHVTRAVIV